MAYCLPPLHPVPAQPPSPLCSWERLLPPSALSHVLEMLVMPRLRRAAGEWEPRQETVPVHAWLHPWLPHLGTQVWGEEGGEGEGRWPGAAKGGMEARQER